MSVVFTPNHFEVCKKITWDDVIDKIDIESVNQQHKVVGELSISPTIILCSDYYPGSIKHAFHKVKNDCGIQILHIYASFSRIGETFGRHCDTVDVLIVQSVGEVSYRFDDGSIYDLTPGDSIYIPKGTYHDPIVKSPRVTLSFSWE